MAKLIVYFNLKMLIFILNIKRVLQILSYIRNEPHQKTVHIPPPKKMVRMVSGNDSSVQRRLNHRNFKRLSSCRTFFRTRVAEGFYRGGGEGTPRTFSSRGVRPAS